MKIKVFIISIVSILLLGTASIVSYHYYLLSQADYLRVRVAGVDLIKLGTVQWLYPPRVENAFDKTYDENGLSVRFPLYEHNVIIDQEIDGNFYATVIGTNEQLRYKGGEDTAYICVSPNMQKAPIEGVDPKKDMANYKYVFYGDGYRGQVDSGALDLFRKDFTVGDAAKLVLFSDQPDSQGEYEMLEVILFTSHPLCLHPSAI